ncbi:MAG TPA: efflux RND transporter periplasmic adaptor subunit [Candidatus Saccharimonadales bacterium]|jgi:cobalt-zinc-cadmium efflux system membrane fusion protein|nr:efflux RND transporter periplasmic adaptor subunit [Candidatus Saccharimonadales bacterium]
MKRMGLELLALCLMSGVWLAGCSGGKNDPNAGAPPPLKVERVEDPSVFQVDHPDQFPLTAAVKHDSTSLLTATATVNPDVSRTVPVVSLATGRVVEIKARLGDTVKKGQVLLRVQSADISGAFSDYQKAMADEQLAHTQLERAQRLYDRGAISLNDLQVSQDTEVKAQVDVKTSSEKLRLLGNTNLDQPSGVVDILAPVSGVITDQQVTNAGGVAGLSSPNPFTISDLSSVWVLCDVYEDDLANVRVGDRADIHLNAYPGRVLTGRINNVGPVLDPAIRTAKVRIEVPNPGGRMRVGMFATATFHGQTKEMHAAVPTTAILHLHDQDWIYVPTNDKKFRRIQVSAGQMLPSNMQEIISGITPGQQVVTNALEFQNTVEQ